MMLQQPLSKNTEHNTKLIAGKGYCHECRTEHVFYTGPALYYCHRLIQTLEQEKTIDLTVSKSKANPDLSTDYLFGKARGQMFGVMVFENQYGTRGIIPAFSGQYNGTWDVAGWAPPLFDTNKFNQLVLKTDPKIKKLGSRINDLSIDSEERKRLIVKRKSLSQHLMKEIHSIYTFTNFKGQSASIFNAFYGSNGIPNGTGDCCAPKLLNYAAKNKLFPLGIAEFYWGKENNSKTKTHGEFYFSCKEKCQPILGFILCGLGEKQKKSNCISLKNKHKTDIALPIPWA